LGMLVKLPMSSLLMLVGHAMQLESPRGLLSTFLIHLPQSNVRTNILMILLLF